jgi:hypothetical protein
MRGCDIYCEYCRVLEGTIIAGMIAAHWIALKIYSPIDEPVCMIVTGWQTAAM